MATFGTTPGVKVTSTGGAVTGVTIGRAQYLVLVGHGDNSAGTASTNTPVKIESRSDADNKFGSGTDLSDAYRDARANGANKNYIYGVMANNTTDTESFVTTSSGTLANTPIVDELSRVSAQDVTEGVSCTVNFVYDAVTAPSDANTVNINPLTGDWAADESSDYDITYDYSDWTGAIGSVDTIFNEGDFGLVCTLSNAETVASELSSKLDGMRPDYHMALGLSAAEPNATTDDYKPSYDTANYTDNIDNDAMFLVAPITEESEDTSILGGVAGIFAGHDITDPVYRDAISGVDNVDQKLSEAEASDLRDSQVIPIRDKGEPELYANLSTSTETDWERDYWRRRIVDVSIATTKAVAGEIVGLINDADTRSTAQNMISSELLDLVNAGVLKPNSLDEDNLYVDVYKIDADRIGVDLGITPYGVVKSIEINLTVQA